MPSGVNDWMGEASGFLARWLKLFEPGAGQAPWASVIELGEALQGIAAGAEGMDFVQACRVLLRDAIRRIDLLLEMPAPPEVPLSPFLFAALGPAREWQLALNRCAAAWAAERAAAWALQREDWRVLRAGLVACEAELEHDVPRSLLAFHTRLVAQCEEAHGAALRADAYIAAFGAHANAALEWRDAWRELAARGLGAVGLPTPDALVALERRIAALESGADVPAKKPGARAGRRRKAAP